MMSSSREVSRITFWVACKIEDGHEPDDLVEMGMRAHFHGMYWTGYMADDDAGCWVLTCDRPLTPPRKERIREYLRNNEYMNEKDLYRLSRHGGEIIDDIRR